MSRRRMMGLLALSALVMACSSEPAGTTPAGVCEAHSDCDDGVFCNGVEQCLPAAANAAPDGCVVAAPPCSANQICDDDLDVCEVDCGTDADADGDGAIAIACGGDDCDDTNAARFPGATEVCDVDHVDEDCDPTTVGDQDFDGDQVTSSACCNGNTCGPDCDDNDRATHPGNPELCDDVDNDCDGTVDEGLRVQLFIDADHDGVGADGTAIAACPGTPGVSSLGGDCDDTVASVRPTAPEICDSVDNDCDGVTDENTVAIPWYVDTDGDGWGVANAAAPSIESCVPPAGRAIRQGDCDDSDAQINPEAPERCNGSDDDCNGRADYVLSAGDTEDNDRDGVPDARCEQSATDCDDENPYRNGADSPELCDLIDNDCDGSFDEGAAPVTWYADVDGDGFGDASDTQESCAPLPGRVRDATDCNDQNSATRPNAADGCFAQPNVDDDCDTRVDEAAEPQAFFRDADGDGYGTGERLVSCQFDVGVALRGGDCDDTVSLVNPGALDDCAGLAGVDDDCDGGTDEDPGDRTFFVDDDGDGFGAGVPSSGCTVPANAVSNNDDCDDTDQFRNPMVPDDCSGVVALDDDCDGRTDEAAVPVVYFHDVDMDGFGDATDTTMACVMPAGFVSLSTDCDDSAMAISPAADEVCDDLVDNDCDDDIDCDDPDCAASCFTVEIVTPISETAFPHALYGSDLVARVVDGSGQPVAGRQVTIDPGTLVPEAGVVRTTDGAGQVSFQLRAGIVVGAITTTLSSPGATSATSDVTVAEPAAGYIFTLVNGLRHQVITPTPEYAYFAGGTDSWSSPAATPDGTIYAAWNDRIYRISATGIVEHFAGSPGGPAVADGSDATLATLSIARTEPMVWDHVGGRLLFVNSTHRVFAIDPATRQVTLIAGGGATSFAALSDVVPALEVNFGSDVRGLTVTPNGIIWVAARSSLVWIDGSGMARPGFLSDSTLGNLTSVAPVPGGSDEVYVTGSLGGSGLVFRFRQNGVGTLVAGGGATVSGTVPALDARLVAEGFIALRGSAVVVVDTLHDNATSSQRVREFTEGGDIRTLAGMANTAGDAGDGGDGLGALLSRPGPAAIWMGHVVFADQDNDAIRVIW